MLQRQPAATENAVVFKMHGKAVLRYSRVPRASLRMGCAAVNPIISVESVL